MSTYQRNPRLTDDEVVLLAGIRGWLSLVTETSQAPAWIRESAERMRVDLAIIRSGQGAAERVEAGRREAARILEEENR